MKEYGGVDVYIDVFLTLAQVGVLSFKPRRNSPDANCIGGWMGPRSGMDDVERRKILPLTGTRTPTPWPFST
jgi:hypothetical protein